MTPTDLLKLCDVLRNVSPELAVHDSTYAARSNTNGSSDFALRHTSTTRIANHLNESVCEDGVRGRRSASVSALGEHVCNVLSVGSKEQMFWPNTPAIVALVAYAQSAWDYSKGKCPSNPVRSHGGAIADGPVPVHDVSSPLPASVALADIAPESGNELLVLAGSCDDVFVHVGSFQPSCSEGRAGTTPVRSSALYQDCGLSSALSEIGIHPNPKDS